MSDTTQHVLSLIARAADLSDGARVTFLEFWSRKLAGAAPPTYTELEKVRKVARSTIQRHVEELENCGLLRSVRMPDNRKVYLLRTDVLQQPKLVIDKPKEEKSVKGYSTAALCGLFVFHSGVKRSVSRQEYVQMKRLHAEHGAVMLAKLMALFAQHRVRHHWGEYTIENLEEHIETLKSIVSARG